MFKLCDRNSYDMGFITYDIVFITYRIRFCTVMNINTIHKKDLVHNVLGLLFTILDGQHLLYQ